MKSKFTQRIAVAACACLLLSFTVPTFAADKPGVAGKWKWSVERNGQKIETTLTLKQDGEKLTGTVSGRNNTETEITDGKFKDGEVSFNVTRERQGQKFTTAYKGKLSEDTIKGTSETERDGQKNSREWEAKRIKAEEK